MANLFADFRFAPVNFKMEKLINDVNWKKDNVQTDYEDANNIQPEKETIKERIIHRWVYERNGEDFDSYFRHGNIHPTTTQEKKTIINALVDRVMHGDSEAKDARTPIKPPSNRFY